MLLRHVVLRELGELDLLLLVVAVGVGGNYTVGTVLTARAPEVEHGLDGLLVLQQPLHDVRIQREEEGILGCPLPKVLVLGGVDQKPPARLRQLLVAALSQGPHAGVVA